MHLDNRPIVYEMTPHDYRKMINQLDPWDQPAHTEIADTLSEITQWIMDNVKGMASTTNGIPNIADETVYFVDGKFYYPI